MPEEITFNIDKLNKIQQELLKKYSARVGVLGNNNNRDDKFSNATIGLKHEFGSITEKIPERSFLRMPLRNELPKELKKIGAAVFEALVKENIKPAFKKLGILGEATVQEAFDTGGFGTWKALSPKTIAKKGFDTILVETTQLRRSITSDIEKIGKN